MVITKTKIDGVYIVERKPFKDERGWFTRIVDVAELKEAGMYADFVQINLCQSYKKGTVRGLHSQVGDAAEDKLVSCIRGAVFDVCVDVRPQSPTYGQYVGEVLSEDNNRMLYVPKGCAHGYMSITDDSMALYFVSQFYTPKAEKGYRFDDPFFNIKWPVEPPYIVSAKDLASNFIN
ncbi:MAG: dTDP-4-dehydrorhamnose 3,5-epimerase [Clostridiales bacterium]|nr:dTDP-4-dehydrorhamnose 3,5-epimerase [Clostridiales bacterium]